MKTQISQFCKEFGDVLTPLSLALQGAVDGLSRIRGGSPLRNVTAALADVRHRVGALVDKVRDQQAYVLVFGPLKSGKSTLLNAIAASYVSEVTTLPAYPCMVHVKHADQRKFSIHRYNGERQVFTDAARLRGLIDEGHRVLAERIRAVEEQGRDFDPGVDYPEAIRRVDVELLAEDLRESGTVLVDTPGLYSRMKFGYDLMTREFRHSAASAVFVVKTENLFLEQVFNDFNDLLEMFSRIFVVVNIDTAKRDLGPDGSLQPSLESTDPVRIVEAFESLAMVAPLRKAAQDGRLRIYPVDLLTAAASRLRGEPAENGRFEEFLGDLTEYLNSADYLREFMDDSLRQGGNLCEEIRTHCESDAIRQCHAEQQQLAARLEGLDSLLASADRVAAVDWPAAFQKVRGEHAAAAQVAAREIGEELARRMSEALDRWLASDDSLASLARDYLDPAAAEFADRSRRENESRLRFSVGTPSAGADVASDVMGDLGRLDLSLRTLHDSSMVATDPSPDDGRRVSIDPETIPVSKRFWDYVLFRSLSATRRKVFGPPDTPELPIPAGVKARRLGPPARQALEAVVDAYARTAFPAEFERLGERMMGRYVDAFCRQIDDSLASARKRLSAEKTTTQQDLAARRNIVSLVEQLLAVVEGLIDSIDDLTVRHGRGPAAAPEPGENGEAPEAELEPEATSPDAPQAGQATTW